MKITDKIKEALKKITLFALLVFMVILCVVDFGGVEAHAAVSVYSSVLDDLQKDESFDVFQYPANSEDYSITVIQIAESANGNLYVYTYQPCMNSTHINATEISMSLTDKMGGVIDNDTVLTDEDEPELYQLLLTSYNGVFAKYLVLDFKVDYSNSERHYNIASIYRNWIKGIDDSADQGSVNNINAVSFRVAQHWAVYQDGDNVEYDMIPTEVIEVTDKYLGYLEYTALDIPWWLGSGNSFESDWQSWYVAFDTDLPIDKLKSARITYSYWSFYFDIAGNIMPVDLQLNAKKTLTCDDKTLIEGNNRLDRYTYEYKCIQSVEDFKATEKLTDSAKEKLEGKKWVLRFKETKDLEVSAVGLPIFFVKTQVSNVSILRLEFETDGQHYNLGVVDNKQSPLPNQPADNVKPGKLGFWAYVWRCIVRLFNGTASFIEGVIAIFALFVCIAFIPLILLILSLIFPSFGLFLKTVLKAIGNGLLWIVKGIGWLISRPFVWIKALIEKCRGEE